jgi:hypothetical protein
MASAALDWALANGISADQYNQNIINAYADAQSKGLSDAQIESTMNQYGVSAADVANAFRVPVADVQSRLDVATPTTAAEIAFNNAAMAELAGRQAQWDAAQAKNATDWAAKQKTNVTDWAAQQKANEAAWAEQQRLNALKNQQQIAANQAAWAAQQKQNEAAWAAQQKANAEAWAKQQAGGTTTPGLLGPTGATSVTGTTPFANATQGFAQNFANYTSIPIGAQYNPNVTVGGASPYSQVMSQMRPVGNPYAGVVAGQAMGGYNPGLYDQINAANIQKAIAANAGTTLTDYYSAGDSGGDGGGTGGGGGATGGGGGGAMAKGGYVHGGLMFGPNPPGPDDGAVNLDMGEYVIKKSSVNKYGRGLLDMINEGKVPAKKMKSLLG